MGRRPNPKPAANLFSQLLNPFALVAERLSRITDKREIPSYKEFSKTIKIPDLYDPTKFNYYDPKSDRVQELWLDLLDANKYGQYVFCAPPQIGGKTLVAVMIPTMRDLFERRVSVGYGLPTGTDIRKSYGDKLKPSIEESGYGAFLPESGPGARGGQAPSIRFEDREQHTMLGRLIFLTMDAYSSTVQTAIVDELDQFWKHGEAYRQGMVNIFSRTKSAREAAMNIACGTVENDEGSLLLSEVRAGTHFRLAHKCPKCKGYFRAEFGLDETTGSMLIYEKGQGEAHAAETATYSCGASGCILSEDDRQEAIAGAELIGKDQECVKGKGIVGPINETKASLITHALDCTRGSLPVIARDHYLAQKAIDEDDDHSAMRMYYRYVMCAEYNKDTDADLEGLSVHLTRAELHRKSKASNYAVGEVPEGFTYCLLSIDVQHSRCYYVLSAFSDLQCADVDYGYEMFCKHGEMPTKLEKFQGLDRAIEKALETCQNNEVDLIAIPLDVGDKQDELEEYIKWSAFGDMLYPVKGIGEEMAKSMGRGKVVTKAKNDVPGVYFLRKQPAGWILTSVDTDAVRHKVQDSYRLKADKPGANLLPQGIEVQDYYFKHLTDAKWIRKPSGKMGWQQPKRVDFLDCKIYMAAVNYRIKVKMKAAGGLNDLDVPAPNDSDAPQEKPQPKIDKNISPKKADYHF